MSNPGAGQAAALRPAGSAAHLKLTLALYCSLFFPAWYLFRIAVLPAPASQPDILQLPVWLLPALALLAIFRASVAVSPRQVFGAPARPLWLASAAGLLALAAAAMVLPDDGAITLARPGAAQLIEHVLIAAVTEEVVFRGWILNAMLSVAKPATAVVLSSLAFAAVHVPIWAIGGVFAGMPQAVLIPILVFILGAVCGLTFLRCRSVWAPLALHMLWNLAALVLE